MWAPSWHHIIINRLLRNIDLGVNMPLCEWKNFRTIYLYIKLFIYTSDCFFSLPFHSEYIYAQWVIWIENLEENLEFACRMYSSVWIKTFNKNAFKCVYSPKWLWFRIKSRFVWRHTHNVNTAQNRFKSAFGKSQRECSSKWQ